MTETLKWNAKQVRMDLKLLKRALARIHRRTALGTALEEARGCL